MAASRGEHGRSDRGRGCRARGVAAALLSASLLLAPASAARAEVELPPVNFMVAFIGDQGIAPDEPEAVAVLQLIKSQGADAVVHAGDFDYNDDPAGWDAQIDAELGSDFPYFASAGNHDVDKFYGPGGYQTFLASRMQRLQIPVHGDLGVQSSFTYQGIFFVLTAPDDFGPGDDYHDAFIEERLMASDAMWRISAWHKNMELMQVGGKSDSTGWGVYEASKRGGAIIATGHEHSYSRTHLLSSMQDQTIASSENTLRLALDDPETMQQDEGRGFAFVSGLGGKSIRDQELEGPWWASIYTSTQNADYGALFGVFHYDGDPRLAYFYFQDISGSRPDTFWVESPPGLGPPCADGIDNDGDGRIDFDPVTFASPGDADTDPAGQGDPGCRSPTWSREDPLCQDGIDNDGDGRIDYDAGRSIHGFGDANGPDPQCEGSGRLAPWAWKNRESYGGGCGLGLELALLLAPLALLRRRLLRPPGRSVAGRGRCGPRGRRGRC